MNAYGAWLRRLTSDRRVNSQQAVYAYKHQFQEFASELQQRNYVSFVPQPSVRQCLDLIRSEFKPPHYMHVLLTVRRLYRLLYGH